MKTKADCLLHSILVDQKPGTTTLSKKEKILRYYEIAGPDYKAWSPGYNMHFGYYAAGVNPLAREKMLNRMNDEVLDRLDLPVTEVTTLADMGCGLGATARFAAKKFDNARVTGITIVPWQVEKGQTLTAADGLSHQVTISEGDYTYTPFENNSIDGAYAIESSCYASGGSKEDLINEMHRILKPGCKLVIADGLIKEQPQGGIIGRAYKKLLDCWALKELGQVEKIRETLISKGFCDIQVEDISWRVAPSVAHVPFTVMTFLLKQLFTKGNPMTQERWNNLTAPLLTMIVGLSRKHFGYYLITATKSYI